MVRKLEAPEPVKADMTPMIDCTFLLLIFFILTLKFKILEGRLDAALPKDMGTSNSPVEEIEKVDVLMFVSEPGELVNEVAPDGKVLQLKHFVGRQIRYEIGTHVFRNIADVERHLSGVVDKDETPVTLDPKKGIIYEDVAQLLDAVIRQKFKKVSFAGSQEND